MHLTFSTFQYLSLLFPAFVQNLNIFASWGLASLLKINFYPFLLLFFIFFFEFQTPRQMGKESKIDEFQEGGRIFFQNCNFVISARAAKH